MSQANAQAITVLPMLSTVPAGMMTEPVVDEANSPFIADGDWLVIDPNVTEFENGALYLFREPIRDHVWHVTNTGDIHTVQGKPAIILSVLNPELQNDPAYRSGLACIEWAKKHVRGRVVGIHQHETYSPSQGLQARILALQAERQNLMTEEERLRAETRVEKYSGRGCWEFTEMEADNKSGEVANVEARILALQNALSAQRVMDHFLTLANVA